MLIRPGPYTQTPYKLVTSDIQDVDETTTSVKYAIAPSDVPTVNPAAPATSDQTGLTFTSVTPGQSFTGTDYYIYDQGDNPEEPLHIVPISGTAGYCYSDDLINWTFTPDGGSSAPDLDNPLDKGRYIWIQSNPSQYSGGWTITGGATVQPTFTFPGDVSTNPDLQYFKEGDKIQEIHNLGLAQLFIIVYME